MRLHTRALRGWLVAGVLVAGATACGGPASTSAPAPVVTSAPTAAQPTTVAATAPTSQSASTGPPQPAEAGGRLSTGEFFLGQAEAPVTLEEWGDFQ